MKIIEFKVFPRKDRLIVFCEVLSKGNIYNQRFEISEKEIIDRPSCDCAFGSFWGQSKKNQGKACKHIGLAMKKLKEIELIKEVYTPI